MQSYTRIALCVLAVVGAAGCASTKVVDRHEYTGGKILRPAHIWVYDFGTTPADVPSDSAFTGQHSEHPAPQTAQQIATGRQVGQNWRGSWSKRSVAWGCRQSGLRASGSRKSTTL